MSIFTGLSRMEQRVSLQHYITNAVQGTAFAAYSILSGNKEIITAAEQYIQESCDAAQAIDDRIVMID